MFSPERFGPQRSSFGKAENFGGRNFVGLKTAFRQSSVEAPRTPLQKQARLRFSEPVTPSVQDGRGYRASDLTDPHKREFLTELTGKIFNLASKGDGDREEGKISLERLFTPATDSGDLTPKKKKAYASSAFYRPDHPTIDDQVELAQRISFSLVDDNNKLSRGQSMYMKRKKRATKWIHQGGSGTEGLDEDSPPQLPIVPRPASMPPMIDDDSKKPAMKLLMNPKGVQDFQAVQQHYQNLMDTAPPTSPEVNKLVTEVQSPTGKGAELFAKRKKRMDKFIVDETTVQKAVQQTSTMTQQQSFNSSTTSSSSNFTTKKQQEMERNKQQEQIMEQFLKERESSLTLVKSPWEAALETGCAATAFEDTRYKTQLANTVCDRADNIAAAQPWLEMPKPVPVAAPPIITPAPPAVAHHTLLDFEMDKDDKRRSACFNMAAKGWGTYNKFYTPITFAAAST